MFKKNRKQIVFYIQKRLGIVGGAGLFLIGIINIVNGITNYDLPSVKVFFDASVLPIFILSLVFFLSGLRNNKISKIVHVALFIVVGCAATLQSDPGSLRGTVFIVLGVILGIQYDLLKKHFWWYFAGIIATYTACIYYAARQSLPIGLPYGIPTAFLTGMLVYAFWIAFAEEIRQYTKENKELKEEIEKNQPFLQFGRNVAEVVHNLKSRFMAIDGFSDLIELESTGEVNEYAKMQKEATTLMLKVINNLLSTVRSYQKVEKEPILLHKLVEGALELLRSNMDFKHNVDVTTVFDDDDKIFASPLEIMQMLDNLIKNAHEAMMGSDSAKLSIETRREDDRVLLRVADTGSGIPYCPSCKKKNCIQCPSFEVGKTTKEHGTGLGMVFVIDLVKEMDGGLDILSSPQQGTTIEIRFPYCDQKLTDDGPIDDESAAS